VLGLAGSLALTARAEEPSILGFGPEASAGQREREARFRDLVRAEHFREPVRRLSARPHHAGSAYGRENAQWLLERFREWGFDAAIESFEVLMPTPRRRAVELVAPTRFVAKLDEPALAADPTSSQKAEQLPTFNAYSADGDVTAPLVYVNFGLPEDYEQLERLGVQVQGKIVIARYGRSWRGVKPKLAAEHGAVGCLIYSDPREDGFFQGEPYPQGPWRPRDGVQRGSVLDIAVQPGDPLTPGIGATPDAPRLPLAEARAITRVPVMPISWGDAQPLLAALGGPVAPLDWRGALPITYHVGPGPAKVRLLVESNWSRVAIHDVVARIPGASEPNQWVIRGNHHDAWANGAQDPLSGLAALLEEARALGELLKQGWRPRRTIVYAAWDAEEPMLLGSTEWAETHAVELAEKAVAYINTDSNGRGFVSAAGSHALERLVNDVARDIVDPETRLTAWKREQLRRVAEARSPEERQEARTRSQLRIEALGSGSDYTVFLDHLGVASLNLGYGGEDGGGVYHSIYDSFAWYMRFSDSDFAYGRALAQTVGTAVLRLADAPVLPFDFAALADAVRGYAADVQKQVEARRQEARERNRQLEEGVFAAVLDPKEPLRPPKALAVPPHLNFAPLDNAVEALARSAERFEAAAARSPAGLPEEKRLALNRLLIESERRLTRTEGLPGRPWFRHLLYAPGAYTGYGVKTLPGVREAIEGERWAEAESEIARLAAALADEAALLDSATALF
jgi:N-acetylated-alpha-linked acidic dipeptidase